jgi:hypothetical protein
VPELGGPSVDLQPHRGDQSHRPPPRGRPLLHPLEAVRFEHRTVEPFLEPQIAERLVFVFGGAGWAPALSGHGHTVIFRAGSARVDHHEDS